MAKHMLKAQFPFTDLAGDGDRSAGISAHVNLARSMVGVIARKGMKSEVASRIKAAFGIEIPEQPAFASNRGVGFVGTGPNSWLAVDENDTSGFFDLVEDTLSGVAAVCDQSDGYAVVRVAGPDVYWMLAKGVQLDLHPDVFVVGSAAVTSIAHIGASLWRCPDENGHSVFEIIVFRSMAGSFWHWLSESAAEFGLSILDSANSLD